MVARSRRSDDACVGPRAGTWITWRLRLTGLTVSWHHLLYRKMSTVSAMDRWFCSLPSSRCLREQWDTWHPEVPLTALTSHDRDLGRPFADFLRTKVGDRHVFVLITEVEPADRRARMLRNNRGNVLERAVRRSYAACVSRSGRTGDVLPRGILSSYPAR